MSYKTPDRVYTGARHDKEAYLLSGMAILSELPLQYNPSDPCRQDH